MAHRPNTIRAFTLVEILIVVVILGILAATVVPSFANATEPTRQTTFITNMKDFAEAAQEHSIGPSKSKGGDLGFFEKEQMVPSFSEAAFALEPGSYTESPVQTQFGWHVIKTEERRKAAPPSLEELRPELRQEIVQDAIAAEIDRLKETAQIERMEGAPPAPGAAQ